jgi:hypothetical protein
MSDPTASVKRPKEARASKKSRQDQKSRVVALGSALVNGGVMLGLSFVPAVGSSQSTFRFIGITIFLLVPLLAWITRE